MRKQNNSYKRGIAMEMAIGMMFVMVALSIILYTVSMLQIKNFKSDVAAFEEKVLNYQAEGMTSDKNYTTTVNGKSYEITVDDNNEPVFTQKDGDAQEQ